MENVLLKIIEAKRVEVAQLKQQRPLSSLMSQPHFHRAPLSLAESIKNKNKNGIIAEYKRASPSKGIINDTASVAEVAKGYEKGGAAGISVLTDEQFFKGSIEHLATARSAVAIPLLRKEFIIDEYQVYEAKAFGADAVLLIAACLSPTLVQDLAHCARSLGLEVLLELHEEKELEHLCTDVSVVGINNRNLKTFEVNLQHSIDMAKKIKGVKVAESGIDKVETIHLLKTAGFDGFLIGERFMREPAPGEAFVQFAQQLGYEN